MKSSLKNNVYFLKYVKNYTPKYFYLRMLTVLIAPVQSLISMFVMQIAIDWITQSKEYNKLYLIILTGFLILLVSNLIVSLIEVGLGLVSKRVLTKKIQGELLKKSERMDFSCFDNTEFYDKYTRAMSETDQRCIKVFDTSINFLSKLITLISVISVLVVLSPPVILVCVVLIGVNFILNKQKNSFDFEYNNILTPLNRKVNYIKKIFYEPQFAQEVRMGKLGNLMHKKFQNTMDEMYKEDKRYAVKNTLFTSCFSSVGYMLTFSVIGIACWQISAGILSVGGFAALLNGAEQIFMGFYGLLNSITEINLHSKFIDNFKFVMDYVPEIEKNTGEELNCNENGDIEIKNVSFIYPKQKEYVLKDLSMHIPKGKKVAIVGYNGAGKTTLIKLLLRLYDPTDGEILWNGKSYKEYDVSQLRSQYSVVFQNYQCYALSVSENIAFKEDCSEKELESIVEATKKSGIYEKILDLPNGYNTNMSREFDKSGVPFSGGEQQKIAISRSFYEDRNVIIMDEPSSALDPIAEYEMNANIMSLAKDKTLIMISHRLSSICMFDEIFVIGKGKVMEHGTHDALMEKAGIYYDMFTKQASNYWGKKDEY